LFREENEVLDVDNLVDLVILELNSSYIQDIVILIQRFTKSNGTEEKEQRNMPNCLKALRNSQT